MSTIKSKKNIVLMGIIIIIQSIYMVCSFAFLKQGYHTDEIWSYGLANSSEGAYIYTTDNESEFKNINSWIDGSVLRDYITVGKDEIFNYKSTYENCKADWHPPLYFYILHFISSFSPGKWSGWYAFIINIFAFLLIQIYLYRLIKSITKDETFALLGILFYGFTMGATFTIIFLRNYTLGAAFTIMFMYYSNEVYANKNDEKNQWRYIIKAGISCLLGCLTVHLSILAFFIITLLYSLNYLFGKNFKLMLRYGLTMALSVALSFLLFLPSIIHLFIGREGSDDVYGQYPAAWQFKIYWAFLNKDIVGFHNSIWPTMTDTYILLILGGVILIGAPLCFVFRKEEWFKKLVQKTKNGLGILWEKRKHFPYGILVLFASVNFVMAFNSKITSIFRMGEYSRRYNFIIYALFGGFILTFFYYPVKWIFNNVKVRNVIISIMLIIIIGVGYISRTDVFYFEFDKMEGKTIEKECKSANAVLLMRSPALLTCASNKLMYVKKFYMVIPSDYDEVDNYNEVDIKDEPLYVIIDEDCLYDETSQIKGGLIPEDVLSYYIDVFGRNSFEYKGKDCFFNNYFVIYKLN